MIRYKEKAYLSDLLLAEVLPAWSRQTGVIAAGADLPMGTPLAKVGGKFQPVDFAGNAAAKTVVAILAEDAQAATEDVESLLIRRGAVINPDFIAWPAGATDTQKSAAIDQLEFLGIVARPAI